VVNGRGHWRTVVDGRAETDGFHRPSADKMYHDCSHIILLRRRSTMLIPRPHSLGLDNPQRWCPAGALPDIWQAQPLCQVSLFVTTLCTLTIFKVADKKKPLRTVSSQRHLWLCLNFSASYSLLWSIACLMSSLRVGFGLILRTFWRHHDGQDAALNQLAEIIDYCRPRLMKAQIIRILKQINDVFNGSLAIAPAP